MAEGVIKLPDGREFKITAPDEATLMEKSRQTALRYEAETLPELTFPAEDIGSTAMTALGFFTTPDINARIDIIKKNFPDAKVFPFDDNAIIEHKGQRSVVNKPGFSVQDVGDFASSVVKFLPAGKAASATAQATGKLAAGAAVGSAASGATSVVEDLAAIPQGSQQGVIGGKVATDAVFGGMSEFLAPILTRSIGFLRNIVSSPGMVVDGVLTEAGERAVAEAGFDPSAVRAALTEVVEQRGSGAIADNVLQTDGLEALTRQQEAADLGVNLTRGQATQDFAQQSLEDTLRTSDVTTRAGRLLREFDDTQVNQLANATRRGSSSVDESGEGIVSAVRGQYEVARRAVDDAYAAARELDGQFTPESVSDMVSAVRVSVEDEIVDATLHPASNRVIKQLRVLQSQIGNPNFRFKDFPIKRIETMRRQIANLRNSAKNADDARLVGRMQRAYDQWLDEAIDSAAFSGDQGALEALKQARAANTSFRNNFNSQSKWDSAGKIVENLINRDVTGREAVNYIFGASSLGRKQGVTATVQRLRQILPENEFNIVREGAWARVVEKAFQGGTYSRKRALAAIDDALDGNGSAAMRELFQPEEILELRKLRRVISSTVTPDAATGPSGTPRKIAQMMQQFAQNAGLAISATTQNPLVALLSFSGHARNVLDFRKARDAARGFTLPRSQAAAIPAVGVAVGRESENEN